MASIDIKPQNIQEGDIDINLLEIDSRSVHIEEHNQWELTDAAKYGHLNKIGEWNNTTLEIVGEIENKDVNNAIAIVYCKWTNSTGSCCNSEQYLMSPSGDQHINCIHTDQNILDIINRYGK